jgi:endonuclease/exonuclease/phosphatase family metal-dependent hydrolase
MFRISGLEKIIQVGFTLSLAVGCATEDAQNSAAEMSVSSTENVNSPTVRDLTCRAGNRSWGRHYGKGVRGNHGAPNSLRAITYNAALAPGFEPLAIERTPAVIFALTEAAAEADILCVQEFWETEALDALTASLTSELPHAVRMAKKPGKGGCSESEMMPLFSCLGTNCSEASPEEFVGCAVTACPVEVASLSGGCLGCVMNHLSDLGSCLAEEPTPSDPAIFGGNYDVGLYSRWPIQKVDKRELSSYFVRASVLHARIVVPKLGPVDTFCTHLGSDLGIVSYAGPYGSWEGEHQKQIEELLALVREVNRNARPAIILGDLNTGPAKGLNAAVLPEHFAELVEAGFDSVHDDQPSPSCTYCAGTTFREPSERPELLDHILSARLPLRGAISERLFDVPVSLGSDLPPFNLSDHWGLKVSFPLPK